MGDPGQQQERLSSDAPPTTMFTSASALVTVRVRATGLTACCRCTCRHGGGGREGGAEVRWGAGRAAVVVAGPANTSKDFCQAQRAHGTREEAAGERAAGIPHPFRRARWGSGSRGGSAAPASRKGSCIDAPSR